MCDIQEPIATDCQLRDYAGSRAHRYPCTGRWTRFGCRDRCEGVSLTFGGSSVTKDPASTWFFVAFLRSQELPPFCVVFTLDSAPANSYFPVTHMRVLTPSETRRSRVLRQTQTSPPECSRRFEGVSARPSYPTCGRLLFPVALCSATITEVQHETCLLPYLALGPDVQRLVH